MVIISSYTYSNIFFAFNSYWSLVYKVQNSNQHQIYIKIEGLEWTGRPFSGLVDDIKR